MSKIHTEFTKGSLSIVRGHLAFEDILQSLQSSTDISIATYNISTNPKDPLLEKLKSLSSKTKLRIYTNIPGKYFSSNEEWQSNVKKYLKLLQPTNFQATTDVRFNLENHAKVILTSAMGYVGSANFSSRSSNNFEVGVCSADPAFLKALSAFFDSLQESSVPFCKSQYFELAVKVLTFRSEIRVLIEFVEDEYQRWNIESEELELRSDFVSFSPELIAELKNFLNRLQAWIKSVNPELDFFSPANSLEGAIQYFDNLEVPSYQNILDHELEQRSLEYFEDNKAYIAAEAQEAATEQFEKIRQELQPESKSKAEEVRSALLEIDINFTDAILKIASA